MPDGFALVGAQVVDDDNIAGPQSRHEDLLDMALEGQAIDRSVDHARSGQPVAAQSCEEGAGLPVAMRYRTDRPLTPQRARVRAMLVLIHVSSTKTRRLAFRPGWSSRHAAGAAATSGRSCSAAWSVSFQASTQ